MATDNEGLSPNEMGPPVDVRSTTGDNSANQTAEIQCRQSMGIVPVKQVLYESAVQDAERLLIDCTVQGRHLRLKSMGCGSASMLDPQSATMMVAVMKTLAHLNANDRVNEQEGSQPIAEKLVDDVILLLSARKPVNALSSNSNPKTRFKSIQQLGIRDGFWRANASPAST